MVKYYVTRWKRKYAGCRFYKIKQSLRSFHFDNFEQSMKFFKEIDVAVYCANLKSFDEETKRVELLERL